MAHLLGQGQSRGINDGGPGIGHGTNHGDTPSQGSSCARGKVFFVCPTWFPKVHVDVNQSWGTWGSRSELEGEKIHS